MGNILAAYRLINYLFSSYLTLLLLWVFSVICVYTSDELARKGKVKMNHEMEHIKKESPDTDSIGNAETYVQLLITWLYDEERVRTGSEFVEEKIGKLQGACKVLKRIQIITDSLKKQAIFPTTKSKRILKVTDRFEYIKAYMELRLYMLTSVQTQFKVFVDQGKCLKIWLSEALEFHESLHSTTCVQQEVVQQHLFLLQTLMKASKVIGEKIIVYKCTASKMTMTLQEINTWSDVFQQGLSVKTDLHGSGRWTEHMMESVTVELSQLEERFATVNKLNECYQTHLDGLHQRALPGYYPDQENSWKINRLSSMSLDVLPARKLGI